MPIRPDEAVARQAGRRPGRRRVPRRRHGREARSIVRGRLGERRCGGARSTLARPPQANPSKRLLTTSIASSLTPGTANRLPVPVLTGPPGNSAPRSAHSRSGTTAALHDPACETSRGPMHQVEALVGAQFSVG
jgi:hypothetical protein